ncbi:MAG: hypothetical protein ACK5Z5_05155, partial [Neisseriaceae bacterium]
YIIYQAIAIGGFMISTIINQVTAGRVAMTKVIRCGAWASAIGLFIIAVFYNNILMIAVGLCLCCVGLGLQNGTMFRILGKLEVKSQSMLFSLMTFIQVIIMAVLLEVSNNILNKFNYSLASFAICAIIFGVLSLLLVIKFVSMNKQRNWQ